MPDKASLAMEGRLAWPHSGPQGEQTAYVPVSGEGTDWMGGQMGGTGDFRLERNGEPQDNR